MEEYGADTVRFYMLHTSPVWTPLKFDVDGLKEIYSKYISTFKNAYSFFEMYANADHIDPREYNIPVEKRELIDRWLISKLNKLIKGVNEAFTEYDLNKAVKLIVPILNDDLSNWYIRSNRRRFWDSELTEELILEGLAREFVRNVQALRKEKDFVITDHIKVYYNGTDKVEKMFALYKEYIMGEVLGDELIKDVSLKNKYELNEEVAYIDVEKIK